MIKPFKVITTREEVDNTVTIFYTVSRSVVTPNNMGISTYFASSQINVPKEENMDFDMLVFKSLEGTGWL